MQEETIIWEGKPSQGINIGTYILAVIFCWLIFPPFMALWKYIKTNSIKYKITNQRLIMSQGVFTRITDEVNLSKILDVRVEEPFALRLMGLSNIIFITADLTNRLTLLQGLKNGDAIKEEVRKYTNNGPVSNLIVQNI